MELAANPAGRRSSRIAVLRPRLPRAHGALHYAPGVRPTPARACESAPTMRAAPKGARDSWRRYSTSRINGLTRTWRHGSPDSAILSRQKTMCRQQLNPTGGANPLILLFVAIRCRRPFPKTEVSRSPFLGSMEDVPHRYPAIPPSIPSPCSTLGSKPNHPLENWCAH